MKKKLRAFVLLALLILTAFVLWRRSVPDQDPVPRQILTGRRSELDQTQLTQGVVEVRYTGNPGTKLKVQITRKDGVIYNYDLNSAGDWERFPLTQGDGAYTVALLEHIEGDRYNIRDTYDLDLALEDPTAPFLLPSQIVNYAAGPVLTLAANLADTQASDAQQVAILFDYVVDHVTYDYEKSATAAPGYLPDVEETLATGKGICFDYAALLCAMVRSRGIPCRLVTGYTDGGTLYHAWVEVFCQSSWVVDDAILITANVWSRLDPTFVSGSERSGHILSYVTNDDNYEVLYIY